MKQAALIGLIAWLAIGVALLAVSPVHSFAAEAGEEPPEHSIFYSPPERVDALFWAIVDGYPVRDLAEAKQQFLNRESKDWERSRGQKLVALEDEFGDMPEYWQARCFFERAGRQQVKVEYLERANQVASDDPATLYLYADRFISFSRSLVDSSLAEEQGQQITYGELAEARLRAVDMMVRAAEQEPQNAFYYYEAANLLGETGDYEGVRELIEKGNAAPVNEYVELFPLSYVARNLRKIRDDDDGSGKFRLLSFKLMNSPVPNYMRKREVIRNFQVILNMTGDIELLNTLHIYACRMGQAKHAPLIHQLVAMMLTGLVEESARELGAIANDADTLKEFSAFARYRGDIRGLVRGTMLWREFAGDEGLDAAYRALDASELTDEQRWEMSTQWWWENQIFEASYLVPEIAQRLWRLESYRYNEDGSITRESPMSPRPSPPESAVSSTVVR